MACGVPCLSLHDAMKTRTIEPEGSALGGPKGLRTLCKVIFLPKGWEAGRINQFSRPRKAGRHTLAHDDTESLFLNN